MPWPFEDIFAGPDPSDPPETEDWALLDELERAVAALAEKLRAEPELSRAEAMAFVKTETSVPGIHLRSLIWPQARRLAGVWLIRAWLIRGLTDVTALSDDALASAKEANR